MNESATDLGMQGDREAILGRIAEALREEAPRHHETPEKPAPSGVTAPFREWLPAVGATVEAQVALFAEQSKNLRTEFRECSSLATAAKEIAALAKELGWKTIALHTGELTNAVAEKLPKSLGTLFVDDGYDKGALEAADRRCSHRV